MDILKDAEYFLKNHKPVVEMVVENKKMLTEIDAYVILQSKQDSDILKPLSVFDADVKDSICLAGHIVGFMGGILKSALFQIINFRAEFQGKVAA